MEYEAHTDMAEPHVSLFGDKTTAEDDFDDADIMNPLIERRPEPFFPLHDVPQDVTATTDSRPQVVTRFGPPYSASGQRFEVRKVGKHPNYGAIKAWIKYCQAEHKICQPTEAGELQKISVIDVSNRLIVQYRKGYKYAALSYVWGGYEQLPVDPSTTLPSDLPKTIEHSMIVCKHLDFAYLWVDSICIAQDNTTVKMEQISIMDRIYEGAALTIVALDGVSADDGLPGVTDVPARSLQKIHTVHENAQSRTLRARCPSFQEQLNKSVWMQRGWTYQEGVLSMRCLFFTQDQVYFRCRALYCSEDLHDSKDFRWFGITKPERPGRETRDDPVRTEQVFGSLQKDIDNFYDSSHGSRTRLQIYKELVKEYAPRALTNSSDGVNAFSALLSRLERTTLPDGFLFGLPLATVRRALLWRESLPMIKDQNGLDDGSEVPMTGNERPKRRINSGLPSWSWVGWQLTRGVELDDSVDPRPGSLEPFLRLYQKGVEIKVDLRHSELAYNKDWYNRTNPVISQMIEELLSRNQQDLEPLETLISGRYKLPGMTEENVLLVEGIVFTRKCYKIERHRHSYFSLELSDRPRHLIRNMQEWSGATDQNVTQGDGHIHDFLLLDLKKSTWDDEVVAWLVLLIWKRKFLAERGGLIRLTLWMDEFVNFWKGSCPRILKFYWA